MVERDTKTVTRLLAELQAGNAGAMDELFPLVYAELRAIAARALRREKVGHTLQPTALVHEAYIRLSGGNPVTARDRVHFLNLAARAMRRILVDHARKRQAAKRHAPTQLPPDPDLFPSHPTPPSLDVIALDQALDRLAALDARQARIVELRFFGDMDVETTADVLGVSTATVKRDWSVAKVWLRRELRSSQPSVAANPHED